MLGVSVCLYAIPSFVSGVLTALLSLHFSQWDVAVIRILSSAVGAAVQAIVGICFIIKSNTFTELLIKDDN